MWSTKMLVAWAATKHTLCYEEKNLSNMLYKYQLPIQWVNVSEQRSLGGNAIGYKDYYFVLANDGVNFYLNRLFPLVHLDKVFIRAIR